MNTEDKLDQLAEFQAQIDYLNMKKQELIDAVKIPDEVLAAQAEANQKRQALDSTLMKTLAEIRMERRAALEVIKDPEMPAEFVAALEAARRKRTEIGMQFDQEEVEAQKQINAAKQKIENELQCKVADVYDQAAQRKADITLEFDGKAQSARENIDLLTAEIKAETAQAEHSIKGKFYQAVYVRGRVTWNTDMLDGMCIAYPALAQARKVGAPSVTLRKI